MFGGKCRGLGVHISFVRSVTMDAFKEDEILRMEKGGNKKCQEFFAKSVDFHDGMTINERYSSDFAEDYKEKVRPGPTPWLPLSLSTCAILRQLFIYSKRLSLTSSLSCYS